MRPGAFSQRGFLGEDERLKDVLEADARTLEELGLSAEELATPLDRLIDAAEASRGRSARVDDRFDIGIEVFTGLQICPWAPEPHSGQCPAAGVSGTPPSSGTCAIGEPATAWPARV